MDLFVSRRLESQDFLSSEEFDCYDGFGQGVFQRRLLLLCILAICVKHIHAYVIPLALRDIDHWCKRPEHWNMSTQEWKNVAIPLEVDGRYSRCRQFADLDNINDTATVPCVAWEYDQEQVTTSIVSQWDLVCHRRLLRAALVVFNGAGTIIVGIVAGSVADTIGRRPVLLASTVTLLTSTLALCLVRRYALYVMVKFVASGSASALYVATSVLFFEITTHENRPLHLVIAGAVGTVISGLWYAAIVLPSITWKLMQAIFLMPTSFSAAAFCVVVESPRWLVAKARLREAEDVMLVAAETNLFPLHNTACLLDKLKNKASETCQQDQHAAYVELLQGVSIRKRAMVVFFSCFSVTFVLRVVLSSSIMRQSWMLNWISMVFVMVSFAVMFLLITRVTLLKFTSACFALLGVMQCMLSLTATSNLLVVKQIITASSKALVFVGYIVLGAYSFELFPTGVRGAAAGWSHGFGGLGATMAALGMPLQRMGREDVSFAIAGSLMFASLLALRTLPDNTTAECAKAAVRREPVFREQNMERMKKTLEQRGCKEHREPSCQSRRSKSSTASQKSTASAHSRQR
ncbi:hypothetical protein V5799_010986 [Amblyomma americanum]|uniref:Major facilitator superfamily (MFS) profile domain-containing protein n=1 Tax=Amblyomma americanum TaxID=6943 RepID=A0AAQ4EIN3_AMBAM